MKGPKTWPGAVALAVVITTAACTLIAAMGWLAGSRWLFTGHNATIWIIGVSSINAAAIAVMAVRKIKADKAASAPKAGAPLSDPRRLSGPGGVYRARKR